ncbi:hypothetical protein D1872_212470 [compost metagenome]
MCLCPCSLTSTIRPADVSIALVKWMTRSIRVLISSDRAFPFSASSAKLEDPWAISSVAAAISPAVVAVSLEAWARVSAVCHSSCVDRCIPSTNPAICSIILLKLCPSRPISSRPLKLARTFRLPRSPSSIKRDSFCSGFPTFRNK